MRNTTAPAAPTWMVTGLQELFEILDGLRVPVNAAQRALRPGATPYYGATGQVGTIDGHIFDEELILLGEDGAPFLDSSKSKAYVIRGKAWVNNHAHVLRALGGTPSNFWKHQLDQVDYHGVVSGTTRLKLSQAPMRRIQLIVPPLSEQRRIADVIESLVSRLDAATASLERAQAKLKAYRASVLKAAVEGRLVQTEAELARAEKRNYEPADVLLKRILAARGRRWEEAELARLTAAGKAPKDDRWKAKYKEPVAPDRSTLAELPEGWCWATVCQFADHRLGKMLDKDKNRGTSRPYLRNANVRWFTFDLADVSEMRVQDTELDEVSIRAGDVVVCEGGEPGRAAVWQKADAPFVIQKALHRVRPGRGISPGFFTYVLAAEAASGRLAKSFTGSTIKHFTGEALQKYCVPLPPKDEQERITEAVEDALSLLAAAERIVKNAQRRITRLRQSILQKAFGGQRGDQERYGEPAEGLGERLRAERAAAAAANPKRRTSRRAVRSKKVLDTFQKRPSAASASPTTRARGRRTRG